ncbi:Wzz/FepE/Etk N-terminal domain-containing protein [Paracrocinitomix mangrovi]|uniref:Wzz/FepE/Etk N-terminal domain-containing protein n=1 Tax=Paracrocinitomix mangrovi TaxID=2862509 RepID=UPI001C8D019A|nr:Wzz/FepE/Etk N-terminal domain-containing protein [Paracrocinitomix mangrovi]UKN02929.1 Wzz/FepE/Etk N-terminal domain-containing protein [Paracrocinitomix mangrovi]
MSKEPNFNSEELLTFLWKKRKPIIIITVAAIVLSVTVSLMMTPYYKATATVFPTRSNSVDFQGTARNSVVEFGDEADAERLLQVLISPEIRDSLTIKYKLYEHYDIDSGASQSRAKFQKAYENNVQFNRTRYNSITIDVFDKEPEVAADMANDIVRLVDTVMNRMIRERSVGPMWAVQHEVELIKTEMGDYSDRLKALSDSGVVGIDARANLNADILEAKRSGDKALVAELMKEKAASKKYGADYDLYSNLSEFFSLRYSNILDVNDQATQYANTNIQQTIRHSMAEVPDKKAKPKRAVIVVFSTISAFLFAVFGLLAIERIKQIKAKVQ